MIRKILLTFVLLAIFITANPRTAYSASCDENLCNCNSQYWNSGSCHSGDCIVIQGSATVQWLCASSNANLQGGLSNPSGWLKSINPNIPGFNAVGDVLRSKFGLDFFLYNVPNFIIAVIIFLLFVTSLIFLLIGGILWITSGGDKEGLKKAKDTVTYAVIGLSLGLLSFMFIRILSTFFNINLVGP